MHQLHWITEHLATGHAPMSYEDLDSIREQGIDAIVNLCGEFCDLHQIEETSGFEVYYLPVADEHAPDLEAMERALDWLDEAIYLGKRCWCTAAWAMAAPAPSSPPTCCGAALISKARKRP
jgi:protein-tyrosine phosphatase